MHFLRRTRSILAATWEGWQKDDGLQLSASTAYFASFSLFPLCMVLIAVLGFVGRYSRLAQTQQQQLVDRVKESFSPWMAEQLQAILAGVQNRASLGGPLGLAVLILAAIGIFMQLENVFDRIWGSSKSSTGGWLSAIREALWTRLMAFLTLLLIGGLLIVVSLTDVVLAAVASYVAQVPGGQPTWRMFQWLFSIAINAALLAMMYHVVPKAPVRWRDALAGGLLGSIIWAIGRYMLVALFVGQSYSAYGIVGALMGVMLWFYYASAVVVIGAEFVHALSQDRHQ